MDIKTLNSREDGCYLCGSTRNLNLHHIFGKYNRKKATQDGLMVWLCHKHHNEPKTGVHFNRNLDLYFKQLGQKKYEETHTREDFMKNYGRNYL